ncbi:hypothetical protein ScPMuIL_014040 [Solemya velum]
MLGRGLRNIPRCLDKISLCRQQIGNPKNGVKVRGRQTHCTAGAFQNENIQIVLSDRLQKSRSRSSLRWDCSTRHFHTTIAAYDDFKVVNAPPFAESITEGDVRWERAVGDYVKEDDVVCEIETDKTGIPVVSPCAGVVEELFAGDGDTVEAGQKLFKLKLTGDAPPPETAAAPSEKAASPPPPPAAAPQPPPPAAKMDGPIPTTPPPVPPLPQAPTSSVPPGIPTPAAAAVPSGQVFGARTEKRVKMNRIRQRIAQRLKEAQNTCAMLTTFNEIDMSNVMEMRNKFKDTFLKTHGVKLGFMSAFVRASSFALQDQPVVNAVIDDNAIVYRDYIDISVAVSAPKGLVVPVLRDCGNMNYPDIEKAIGDLGAKAQAGTLAVEDMDGGTFTISNGGVFGSMFGTPIINPPQSAILGMHAIIERPVVIKGKIEIRPMMYVALTYDHRLIDGREAVTFLRKIKSAVEDPRVLLLDV